MNSRGSLFTRVLPSGKVLDVAPLLTGTVQLRLSTDLDAWEYEDGW